MEIMASKMTAILKKEGKNDGLTGWLADWQSEALPERSVSYGSFRFFKKTKKLIMDLLDKSRLRLYDYLGNYVIFVC